MAEPLCPVCAKRHAAEPFRPFCSKRCADIDLGRWLKGHYVVEGQEPVPNAPEDEPE